MRDKETENRIFRGKSIEKVTGPESMNDYIRVTTPSVWIILGALVLLLIGMIIWSIFGTVTVYDAAGNASEVHLISYLIN